MTSRRLTLTPSRSALRRPWALPAALKGWLIPLLLVLLWEGLVQGGLVAPNLLPAPTTVLSTLVGLAITGELFGHIAITVYRVALGFLIGTLVATVLGALTGYSRQAYGYLDPLLQALRNIPSIAWVPLFILWLGIYESSKITLIATGVFFPVYLNLMTGIQGLDRKLVEVGRVYRLSQLELIRRVFLPAYLVGLRSGLSLGWMFIENVHKTFDNGLVALEAIDLAIKPGEVVSLVGTSGCGKSTLLRILAGLEFPTLGAALIDGEVIRGPHPKVGLIFQEARLFPWLTVTENIQFGLRGLPPLDRQWRSDAVLQKVHLSQFAQALPRQLSGGMAQRVAIARALVTQPHILLLDEPFSALDAFTRSQLQDHLLEIWAEDRPTLLLVTHDVEEALVLSDRIIVLRPHPGRIHRELTLDLPRPRRRSSLEFQQWKETLIRELDLSPGNDSLPFRLNRYNPC